jgi:hypothetical protein
MTGGLALSCKYSNPFAASNATFILVNQSNGFWCGSRSALHVNGNIDT